MMGLATVAVTTLRTLARLHTAHCTLPALATTGDYAGMMHFNPQGGKGHTQLLSGTDEVHFHLNYQFNCARKASKSNANYPQIKQ